VLQDEFNSEIGVVDGGFGVASRFGQTTRNGIHTAVELPHSSQKTA
jgi:hypothetical protein